MHIYIYMCVCVCVWEEEKESGKNGTWYKEIEDVRRGEWQMQNRYKVLKWRETKKTRQGRVPVVWWFCPAAPLERRDRPNGIADEAGGRFRTSNFLHRLTELGTPWCQSGGRGHECKKTRHFIGQEHHIFFVITFHLNGTPSRKHHFPLKNISYHFNQYRFCFFFFLILEQWIPLFP